ncbi:MAG: septum site-determining protein MinC [Lachnospiraceae bacterium]|nr:septum site-determining protein MinC [Lachnospiraceae bacterium]
MKNAVVIKANKAGMTVRLDPELPFPALLEAVRTKFRETARFWGAAQMTLELSGRELTGPEEMAVVDAITESSSVEILCLVDSDTNRIERCEKALNEKLMELSSHTGQFYKGVLEDGDVLESEASIVIIGDVEKGARVTAKGNVVILGSLKGTVWAGLNGNPDSVVVAFEMAPIQIKIGGLSLEKSGRGRPFGRGPVTVFARDGRIFCEPIKKSFLSALNFI